MKMLVMGGTQFFGKRLVNNLLHGGHEVFVLSRGNRPLDFKGKVHHLLGNRNDENFLKSSIDGHSFDVVYDQICFDYQTAKNACRVFNGKVKHYIFTSSQSVYLPGQNLKEEDFDPKVHRFEKEVTAQEDYAEAKRQAEVGFVKFADFDTTFVRFPIVIGEDDYSGRFQFHKDRIQNGEGIYFPNLSARISFTYAEDAAKSLQEIGARKILGPINCCSDSPLSLGEFVAAMEELTQENAVIDQNPSENNHSPYGISEDWFMDNSKAKDSGISYLPVKDILKLSTNKLK